MNYPYIVHRKTICGGHVLTRRYARMICKDISGKMWHCFVYQSIQLVPSKSNHLHACFVVYTVFFEKLFVQVWIFSIADQHKSKTGFSWVRIRNSFGHLSGVRYVLVRFDVIGRLKRMTLYLGIIECIPMVNINLIEPVVKCSNVQPLGTFLEYGIRLMKCPDPDCSFRSCYVTLISRRTSLAHAPLTERCAATCRNLGSHDMRRCCPKYSRGKEQTEWSELTSTKALHNL